jgi:glycosyltransferase involved in cell wall biosynthesis
LKPLNLFYEEPDPDRWIKFDRYPRRVVRRIIWGKKRPGGVGMISINLKKGLDKLGIPYRFNDYSYIKKHPEEIACVIGMPHLLFEKQWSNPVILGAAIYSHPIECPDLFSQYPNVKRVLVPGEWMRKMFEPYYQDKVLAWPVGIDTDLWSPGIKEKPEFDFLIYNKIRWDHEHYQKDLINPICRVLDKHSLTYQFITYGSYRPEDLSNKLKKVKSMIFLCEHETQGLAYQQVLATGTPILAWERGGYWQDPYYYPEKVKFGPVSIAPYWDKRCGLKFTGIDDFEAQLVKFKAAHTAFKPEEYIAENLTLEKCAEKYLEIYSQVLKEID